MPERANLNTRRLSKLLMFLCAASAAFAQTLATSTNPHLGLPLGYIKKDRLKLVRILPDSLDSKGGRLAAPTYAQCEAQRQVPCYGPQQMRNAYGLSSLVNGGFDGTGQTIVVIDAFGSPTILNDLKHFDQDFGLPDPPSFQVRAPLGTVPFDSTNQNMLGWAEETTLDIEWAHAIAPGASIVLLTSPFSGLSSFLSLEQYAVNNNLGKIVSQSWGTTENTLFSSQGRNLLNSFNAFYATSTNSNNVTFLAAAGDSGSSNEDNSGNTYSFPAVLFPASSPWVTAVGGTSLYADANGNYSYETVWNNSSGAGGGGVSQFFSEPSYQQTSLPSAAQAVLKSHRGLPDIAYNADTNTPVLVYISFEGPGYYLFGGTSCGSPQMAGVVAIANQYAGSPIGSFNVPLYSLGAANLDYFFLRDVTLGTNAFAGVAGYTAQPEWDLASGWGTPNLGQLIVSMAQLKKVSGK